MTRGLAREPVAAAVRAACLRIGDACHRPRDSWWETRRSAPVGVGNVVDIEHWLVQVRLGGSDSPLRTFDLRREPLSEQWLLDAITDN